jgi:hypothetical protein
VGGDPGSTKTDVSVGFVSNLPDDPRSTTSSVVQPEFPLWVAVYVNAMARTASSGGGVLLTSPSVQPSLYKGSRVVVAAWAVSLDR